MKKTTVLTFLALLLVVERRAFVFERAVFRSTDGPALPPVVSAARLL